MLSFMHSYSKLGVLSLPLANELRHAHPHVCFFADISGLMRLSSDCSFTPENVPECLVAMLEAVDQADPPVMATQGDGQIRAATPPAGGCQYKSATSAFLFNSS